MHIKKLFSDSNTDLVPSTYFVYFEKEPLNLEPYESFEDSFKVCMSIYFIYNLQYPNKITTLLELVQRMFLKIHPDSGSKSKKINPIKRKVFNFMNKFRNSSKSN